MTRPHNLPVSFTAEKTYQGWNGVLRWSYPISKREYLISKQLSHDQTPPRSNTIQSPVRHHELSRQGPETLPLLLLPLSRVLMYPPSQPPFLPSVPPFFPSNTLLILWYKHIFTIIRYIKLPFSDIFSPTTILPHPWEHTPHPSLLLQSLKLLVSQKAVRTRKKQEEEEVRNAGPGFQRQNRLKAMSVKRQVLSHTYVSLVC